MKTTGSVILGPKTAARILDLGEPRGSRYRGRAAFAISCAIGLVAAHGLVGRGFPEGGGARPKEVVDMRWMTSLAVTSAVAAGSGALAQDAVQWRVEDGGNGHWYVLTERSVSGWETARQDAVSRGAHLASLNSEAEAAFLAAIGFQRNVYGGHVGLKWDSGSWSWVTGEPLVDLGPYSLVASGDGPCSNFVDLEPGAANPARLNDIGCNWSAPYFAEWSADCNGDGIVDYGQIRTGELDDANGNNVPDCCEPGASCTGDLDLGLVAHYPFDGNCLDASGFARHGEPTGISFTTDQVGRPGSAARFSGNGSQMLVQGIPIPTDNAFAWALWIRPDSVGDPGPATPLLERIEAIGSNPLSPSLFIRTNAGLGFGSYGQYGSSSVETPASIVSPAVWTHIACTSTAAGVRRVFVNGELVGEGTSPDYGGALGLLLVGRDRLDCCGIFRGAMDDLRIYSRPLSTSEVQALIELGQPPACNADVTGNGSVDAVDLAAVLAAWGNVGKGKAAADVNADGTVDALDLAEVLSGWGPCP